MAHKKKTFQKLFKKIITIPKTVKNGIKFLKVMSKNLQNLKE